MKKPISPKVHGAIDYTTTLATAAAPHLLDSSDAARHLARGLAGGYGALSATTDYELGAKRVVPFKGHGMAEAALGLVLPAMPWLLGFAKDKNARNYFLGLTAMTFAVAALTDWDAKPDGATTKSTKRSRAGKKAAATRKANGAVKKARTAATRKTNSTRKTVSRSAGARKRAMD